MQQIMIATIVSCHAHPNDTAALSTLCDKTHKLLTLVYTHIWSVTPTTAYK